MVMMCHGALSLAGEGAAASARAEASTKMDVWIMNAAQQVPGCRQCLQLL